MIIISLFNAYSLILLLLSYIVSKSSLDKVYLAIKIVILFGFLKIGETISTKSLKLSGCIKSSFKFSLFALAVFINSSKRLSKVFSLFVSSCDINDSLTSL